MRMTSKHCISMEKYWNRQEQHGSPEKVLYDSGSQAFQTMGQKQYLGKSAGPLQNFLKAINTDCAENGEYAKLNKPVSIPLSK